MQIAEVSFTGVGALMLVAAALPACFTPPDRGYYAPAGMELGNTIATYREERVDLQVLARCQGAYVNTVAGEEVLT